MTSLDLRILRAILDGKRGADVSDEERREHDVALVGLVQRGLVSYSPARPAQKFLLTATGRAAFDEGVIEGETLEYASGADRFNFRVGAAIHGRLDEHGRFIPVHKNWRTRFAAMLSAELFPRPSAQVTAIDVERGTITLGPVE
jgi:hypothetical protein